MLIWKIFSILLLAVPTASFVYGFLCWRYPPQGPTWAFGFRSRRARASDESWLFAQTMSGRIGFCLGLILLMIAMPMAMKLRDLELEEMVKHSARFFTAQTLLVFLSKIPTELLLLIRFDRFGRLRGRSALPELPEEEPVQELPPDTYVPEAYMPEPAAPYVPGDYVPGGYTPEQAEPYGPEDSFSPEDVDPDLYAPEPYVPEPTELPEPPAEPQAPAQSGNFYTPGPDDLFS